MTEVMMPVGTQAPVPRRRRPGQGKRGATRFLERSSIITRSMQRKRSLIPRKTIKSLPNISGLIVQAIAASVSDNGLTFKELKEVLSAKGYNVRRQSPRIQRKMHALVLKGAVVRMTHGDGSKFFVIRKHQSKASKMFESPKRTAGARKVRVGRRYGTSTGTKTKGAAEHAKSCAGKTGEARQKLRIPNRRKRCPRKNARRSQRLAQKAASSTSDNLGRKAEGRHYSGRRPTSALKTTMNLRSRAASAEKSKRASSKSASERSRSSKNNSTACPKGVGKLHSKETASAKKTRFCKSRDVSSAKEQNPKGKAAFPPRRPKRRARRGR